MKIYTKTGDQGETSLFAGGRLRKSDPRVAAYGEVDELNATLGVALHQLTSWPAQHEQIERVQRVLFGIGGELATPTEKGRDKLRGLVGDAEVAELERSIDAMETELPALTSFILPGGGAAGATLHVGRTVCRRAERAVVGLAGEAEIRPEVLRYLNRLSDWLFVLARYVNRRERRPESPW